MSRRQSTRAKLLIAQAQREVMQRANILAQLQGERKH